MAKRKVIKSFDWRWKIIWELVTFGCEFGFDNDTIDVFQVGYFFECVIFGIVLKEFIEWVSDEKSVFKLWQLS